MCATFGSARGVAVSSDVERTGEWDVGRVDSRSGCRRVGRGVRLGSSRMDDMVLVIRYGALVDLLGDEAG